MRSLLRFSCCWIFLFPPVSVLSQDITKFPDQVKSLNRLGIQQPKLPENRMPQKNSSDFELPPVEIPSKSKQSLSMQPKIWVSKFLLAGNTVFSDQQLKVVLKPFEGQWITNDELQTARIQLTHYYIDRGYINSGAIIPDQEINRGEIVIHLVEGTLNQIKITGNDWLQTDYVQQRLELGIQEPLNTKPLQKQLQVLQQNPLIDQISARLQPGLKPGESELSVRVKEARPFQIGLVMSNDRAPSIGAENMRFWAVHRNLSGWGDRLFASYNLSEGLHNYTVSYNLPFSRYNSQLQLLYDRSDSNIIHRFTQSEDEPEITGQSELFEVSLIQPIIQTPEQLFTLTIAFQHRHSQTFLDDIGFGFAAGVEQEGTTNISSIQLIQDWIHRSQSQVIAIRSRFSLGIDAFGVTDNNVEPDAKFFTWLGQLQWLRRLPILDSQLLFRADMQFASEALLPLEKFSIGGQNSVRGYRENQWVTDQGINTSLEWRIPVFRLPIPLLNRGANEGLIQLAPFIDFGWAANVDQKIIKDKTLTSAGVGLLWNPFGKIHSQIYWAFPFKRIENESHNLQDSGIHFRMSMEWF